MHNCCTLSQTSSYASISPVTLNNGYAICSNKHGKISQTVVVQYLTQSISVQQSITVRTPTVPHTKKSKAKSSILHGWASKNLWGTQMVKLSSPLCWLSKPWVNDGNTLYKESGKSLMYSSSIFYEVKHKIDLSWSKNSFSLKYSLDSNINTDRCYTYKHKLPSQEHHR